MVTLGPDETLDPLVGHWDVLQLAKGHRGSTDDRLTAWRAIAVRPEARSYLDLGAGVGTVGLTALWHLPQAHLTALEAQEVSHALFKRTVEHNGLGSRVRAVLGDMRDPDALDGSFELITGSPPYMPIGSGLLSPLRPACQGPRIALATARAARPARSARTVLRRLEVDPAQPRDKDR